MRKFCINFVNKSILVADNKKSVGKLDGSGSIRNESFRISVFDWLCVTEKEGPNYSRGRSSLLMIGGLPNCLLCSFPALIHKPKKKRLFVLLHRVHPCGPGLVENTFNDCNTCTVPQKKVCNLRCCNSIHDVCAFTKHFCTCMCTMSLEQLLDPDK